jgi:hypothetical protein
MNGTLAKPESNDVTPEPKLFGMPRPWAGAIIGILSFTVLLLLFRMKEPVYFSGLLYLGNLAVYLLGLANDAQPRLNAAHDVPTYLIAYVVSCLPPAITGSLIASINQVKRAFGCLVLVAYLVFLFFSVVVMAFVSIDF